MTMLPVADVLLIERKRCARCNSTHESVSPFRYRLFRAPSNEPDKVEIRKLKWEPSKREIEDLTPLERRTVYYLDVTMDQCSLCWGATTEHAAALLIRPLPPITHMNGLQSALVDAAERNRLRPKGDSRSRKPALSIDDLAASLGL